MFEYATSWRPESERDEIVRMLQETAHQWAVHNFSSGCEVADMLVERLEFGPGVREALAFTFERWNGKGFPTHAEGEAIPLPMRIVHVSHDMEAIARLSSPEQALAAVRDRRDRTYDPALADLFGAHGGAWLARLREVEPWDAVLALEPEPRRLLEGAELDDALAVAADFIDLKSPYMGGHSRRCAQVAGDAATVLGLPDDAVTDIRRAALVHDFGITAVSNAIWDKPGELTRTEFDRVELHPLLTEQMLRRSPALAVAESRRGDPSREVRRVGVLPTLARRHERSRGVRAGGDGDLRRADGGARRPARVQRRRRGRRAPSAGRGRSARAAGRARRARRRRPR